MFVIRRARDVNSIMEPNGSLDLIRPAGELAAEVELAQAVTDVGGVVVGSDRLGVRLRQVREDRATAPLRAKPVPQRNPAGVIQPDLRRHNSPQYGLGQARLVQQPVAPGHLDLELVDLSRCLRECFLELAAAGDGVKGLGDFPEGIQLVGQQLMVSARCRRPGRREASQLGLSVKRVLDRVSRGVILGRDPRTPSLDGRRQEGQPTTVT